MEGRYKCSTTTTRRLLPRNGRVGQIWIDREPTTTRPLSLTHPSDSWWILVVGHLHIINWTLVNNSLSVRSAQPHLIYTNKDTLHFWRACQSTESLEKNIVTRKTRDIKADDNSARGVVPQRQCRREFREGCSSARNKVPRREIPRKI